MKIRFCKIYLTCAARFTFKKKCLSFTIVCILVSQPSARIFARSISARRIKAYSFKYFSIAHLCS